MGDSSSFSSLFALVDNHLSKSNIQQDISQPSTSGLGSFRLPPLNVQRGLSDTRLATYSRRFPPPGLSMSAHKHPINDVLAKQLDNMFHKKPPNPEDDDDDDDDDEDDDLPLPPPMGMRATERPINDVLATQLNNMFKAREAKEEEERRRQEELRRVAENMQRMQIEESSCLIDLMPAVQQPGLIRPQDVEIPSSGSSMESLVVPDEPEPEPLQVKPEEPRTHFDLLWRTQSPKPTKSDMRYVVKHKIGRCSQFGKVLCSRYRPVIAPYLNVYVPPANTKMFDFATPSPDDINVERMKKPSFYNTSSSALTVFE